MKLCAIIPTYDNAQTLEVVVEAVRAHVSDVIVVDDGSGEKGRAVVEALKERGRVDAVFRAENGGKGAAVKSGLARAHELGFTHALQIDADGQHAASDIPRLVAASERDPKALVLGQPVFDGTAPTGRRIARSISVFWCAVEIMSFRIGDPLCGFRVYPVRAALDARATGDAMDFDPEIAVRLARGGAPVVHVKTNVRYISRADGGVSHYRLFRDTLLISWMHTRMCFLGILWILGWRPRTTNA
jgi:glycosyltransferase involved in cell wall biosynthesis